MFREVKSTKKGRKSIENNPNTYCRLCKNNLLLKFGNTVQSCTNLFKPSKFGISVANSAGASQVVCNTCARKVRLLDTTYDSLKKNIVAEAECTNNSNRKTTDDVHADGTKRKSLEAISPETRSPCMRKVRRFRSPPSKKTLNFGEAADEQENLPISNALNIDDLHPDSESSDLKVVISYPNGNVIVKKNIDFDSKAIIRNIALKQWKAAVNGTYRHKLLSSELFLKLEKEVEKEMSDYCKSDGILKNTEPDQLANFSNKILFREIDIHCPLYTTIVKSACNFNGEIDNEKCVNAMALATSTLVRCRNSTMSAVAYRISTILFHSGASYTDHARLNHLGVCMSPQMSIHLQRKMGENSNVKVLHWKQQIEINKSAILLLQEVSEKQIPKRVEDDMVVEITIDVAEQSLSSYRWYCSKGYKKAISVLMDVQSVMCEKAITEDVLTESITKLRGERLPHFK